MYDIIEGNKIFVHPGVKIDKLKISNDIELLSNLGSIDKIIINDNVKIFRIVTKHKLKFNKLPINLIDENVMNLENFNTLSADKIILTDPEKINRIKKCQKLELVNIKTSQVKINRKVKFKNCKIERCRIQGDVKIFNSTINLLIASGEKILIRKSCINFFISCVSNVFIENSIVNCLKTNNEGLIKVYKNSEVKISSANAKVICDCESKINLDKDIPMIFFV